MRLAVQAFGQDRTGTPLVILHGLLGSARNWQSLAKRLAMRAPVFTLDLRNHGDSPWAGPMTYQAMAEDVSGFLDTTLHGAPVALLGHSMGGKAAMVLALQETWLVERLLVLDIAPVAYPPRFHAYIAGMRAVPLHLVTERRDAELAMAELVPEAAVRSFLLRNLVEGEAGWSWRVNLDAIEQAMPALFGFPDFAPETRYDGPTLFLRGGRSNYVQPLHHATIASLFPQARHDEIAEAGHWVHADRPEDFLIAAGRFLFEAG